MKRTFYHRPTVESAPDEGFSLIRLATAEKLAAWIRPTSYANCSECRKR